MKMPSVIEGLKGEVLAVVKFHFLKGGQIGGLLALLSLILRGYIPSLTAASISNH